MEYVVVWNDEGRKLLTNMPGFGDYSSNDQHKLLWYLTGTLYCYVYNRCVWSWDTIYGVPVCVGTIERY